MNPKRCARWVGLACAALGLAVTTLAGAQTTADGFALNRFEPSERGSDWFALESFDIRGHRRFAAGLVLDYARKPLVIYSAQGGEVAAVVRDQIFGHAGGAIVLWERARFALSLPVAIFQNGAEGTVGTTRLRSENGTTLGDLRLGADFRLAGDYGEPFQLAAGLQLFLPTGSQRSYTGDGAVRVTPRLGISGEIDSFVYAALLGVQVRGNDSPYAGTARGSELAFSAAFGAKLFDDRVMMGLELATNTVFTDPDAVFGRRSTPLELLLGWHLRAGDSLRFNAGVGPGLTRAFGTPQFRAVASVEWVDPFAEPAAPIVVADRDHDAVLDSEDACPDVAGIRTNDPKTNGCPPPADRDHDSVLDDVDACPDLAGTPTQDPKTNGCPDRDADGIPDTVDACPASAGPPTADPKTNGCPDRDGDGIADPVDACPQEAGVANDDPKKHGCPAPKDSDGDGILDPQDACPNDAGPHNADPKKHGCPVARVEKGQIIIREQLQFAYNSAQILKTSDFILEAVLKVIKDNPEILRISVEGHTDSKGGDAYNRQLSQRRTQSVVDWLVRNGVKRSMLEAHGFGEERPIDSNETEEGRANNRRVEFHIREQAPSEAPKAP
jgi:OmpA-OmpF porin, OOP family